MLNLDEKLNYLENKKALLRALPFYEFLLSIEMTYQKNPQFCSFSYEYKPSAFDQLNYIKDNEKSGNISVFDKSVTAFPTNEYGIRDFTIDTDFFGQIGCGSHKFCQLLINNGFDNPVFFKKYKQDFESVLEDFSWIEKREDRFDIYKKYMHRKIPEYTKIIEKWKQGCLDHILSDTEFLKFDQGLLNLKYKKIDLQDIAREQAKLLFYKKLILLKEMLQDYSFIDHFVLSVDFKDNQVGVYNKNNSVSVYNDKIIYSSAPEKEIEEEVSLKFNNSCNVIYPFKRGGPINLNNFVVSRQTRINKSLPIINLMEIPKEEAEQLESDFEKHLIRRKLNLTDDEESKDISVNLKRKRL